jgi:hypothetical protein
LKATNGRLALSDPDILETLLVDGADVYQTLRFLENWNSSTFLLLSDQSKCQLSPAFALSDPRRVSWMALPRELNGVFMFMNQIVSHFKEISK